jgi:hypothetical protein
MIAGTLRSCLFLVALVAAPGCYVEEGPPPAMAYGYAPQYYDGYVVYFDGAGRPFYHVGGAVVWVPATSPYYAGLVGHWRAYGPAYGRWFGHYGYRYRSYRGGSRR